MEFLDALRAQYESWAGMQGPRCKVNERTRHIAAAAAWGLFPEKDATYSIRRAQSADPLLSTAQRLARGLFPGQGPGDFFPNDIAD